MARWMEQSARQIREWFFATKEKSEGSTRGKEQIAFDRGYYTMSDIKTVIKVNEKGDPTDFPTYSNLSG
jgi:hypothetical protein